MFIVSFLPLSPSRFKMRSSDSAKKHFQDTAFCFQVVSSCGKCFVVTIILLVMRGSVKFRLAGRLSGKRLFMLIVKNGKLCPVSELQFVKDHTQIISYRSLA